MKKSKLFIENFLIYGIGGIISKIIPFIMIPIVTRLMPNSKYFGLSDMSQTIVSLCSYFAVMGMYDAMYRLFFEKDDIDYKKRICSTTLLFTIGTSVLVFLLMIIFRKSIAAFFFESYEYAYLVYISAIATLVGATNSIIAAPTRMQNKRKVFLITNAISPILSYSISIPMLLAGYYVIALPLAGVIASLSMEITFYILNRDWFSIRFFDSKLIKELLWIGVPLLPNMLIYWIFNSSDRVMITQLMDIGESGIYAIGSKLGLASQLIYTAFAGGWQYFAFSTMKEEDQVETNSKVFEYLGIISYLATTIICVIAEPFYKLIFLPEYHRAYIVSPYLFFAPLLQMLFQVSGNQFLVIKRSWILGSTLSVGAVISILLKFALIPSIGMEGAAIGTLLGYVISDIICALVLIRMKLMVVRKRFLFTTIAMCIGFLLWRFLFKSSYVLEIVWVITFFFITFLVYRKDIRLLIRR
ncbi:lipopolysaccharide biosynthesis protein [Butyrivibrio sp. VCD2006]|uniref:lipopolysaccharide biosynthesis protein n=1 Tax=Butyrivibrio sp. VCD2006 TaxID=1280664 RepID=UPI000406EB26|nr:oligosaccharide flippase family protein [Butyrivibrio sp. VCD2006]